jgi:hypothetical protein
MSRWVNLDLESLQVDLELGFAAGISDLLVYRQHITVSRPVRYDRLYMFKDFFVSTWTVTSCSHSRISFLCS